jgi:hypothetical protein
MHWNVRSKPG